VAFPYCPVTTCTTQHNPTIQITKTLKTSTSPEQKHNTSFDPSPCLLRCYHHHQQQREQHHHPTNMVGPHRPINLRHRYHLPHPFPKRPITLSHLSKANINTVLRRNLHPPPRPPCRLALGLGGPAPLARRAGQVGGAGSADGGGGGD